MKTQAMKRRDITKTGTGPLKVKNKLNPIDKAGKCFSTLTLAKQLAENKNHCCHRETKKDGNPRNSYLMFFFLFKSIFRILVHLA